MELGFSYGPAYKIPHLQAAILSKVQYRIKNKIFSIYLHSMHKYKGSSVKSLGPLAAAAAVAVVLTHSLPPPLPRTI